MNRSRWWYSGWSRPLVLLLGFLLLTACRSDGFQGSVFRRAPDGSLGPAISGAILTFTSEDGATTKTTTSDATGHYRVFLTPARYRVTANHLAYEPYDSAPGFFVVTGEGLQTGNIFLERPAATIVLLARHAEKAGSDPNTDLAPDPDGLGLGVNRAITLGAFAQGAVVSAVYTTAYCRTAQTGQPAALALAVPLQVQPTTDPNAGLTACDPAITVPTNSLSAPLSTPTALAQHILATHPGETVLVVGHSNTVPQTITALGAPSPCPTYLPLSGSNCFIPENEFNHLFAVTVPGDGSPLNLAHQTYGP